MNKDKIGTGIDAIDGNEILRRKIFSFYSLPLEDDRYDDDRRIELVLTGKTSKFDIYPFESYIVYLFFLTAYNNSLELLDGIVPEAFRRVKEKGIELYGNGLNWSKGWTFLTDVEKEKLVDYIIRDNV